MPWPGRRWEARTPPWCGTYCSGQRRPPAIKKISCWVDGSLSGTNGVESKYTGDQIKRLLNLTKTFQLDCEFMEKGRRER